MCWVAGRIVWDIIGFGHRSLPLRLVIIMWNIRSVTVPGAYSIVGAAASRRGGELHTPLPTAPTTLYGEGAARC